MIINKIHINEYGNLRDRDFEPGEGINIIRGDNESGKSTVMSFVRFVFYGMPQARGADNLIERERSFSWKNGTASGYIEITHDGCGYRIERSVSLNSPERHSIINLATGTPVFAGADAGDVFFGVPGEVYDSVCASRQLGVGNLDGGAVGSAIQNMLLSGNESVNTEGALKKLEKARRELLPLRGSNGIVNQLRAKEESLKDRLETARSNTESILSLQGSVEKYRGVTLDLRKKLDAAVDRCHAYESVAKLKKYGELAETEEKIAALNAERKQMAEKYGKNGVFPGSDYPDRLNSLYRELTVAESGLSVAEAGLAGAKAETGGDPALIAGNGEIAAAGGREKILDCYNTKSKKGRKTACAGVVLLLAGIVLATAAVLALLLLKTVQIYLPVAFAFWGLASVILGIILIRKAGKYKKEAAAYLGTFGIAGKITPVNAAEKLDGVADKCAEAAALEAKRLRDISESEKKLDEKEKQLEQVLSDCRMELDRFPSVDETAEDENIAGRLTERADKTRSRLEEYNRLMAETGLLEKQAISLRKEIGDGTDEASLRAHLLPDTVEKMGEYSLQKLNQERDGLAYQLDAANQKLAEYEKSLAVLTHSTDNPVRLTSELEAATAEREAAEMRSAAVILAADTIRSAGDSLRQSVTPRIRKRAGELMSLITGGKYGDFGIDDDFRILISTEDGTRDVNVLSGGTRDAAYFSLRIALTEMIFGNSLPPLMLDEITAQLDDSRTASVMNMLGLLAEEGMQLLVFTCHRREENILSTEGKEFGLLEI